MEIKKALLDIVQDYIECDPTNIDTSVKFKLIAGIDSFVYLTMISAIEENFSIRIPNDKLLGFETLDDIINYLETVVNK
jgi:Acyl carrier protein